MRRLSELATRRRRIPLVRQLGAADCGAACLCMVLGYFGKWVDLKEVRDTVGAGRGGTDAAALVTTARMHGLRARVVTLDIQDLTFLSRGSILHWEFQHFVVYESHNARHVWIADPAVGRRRVPIDRFKESFTGVAILFEPTAGLGKGSRPRQRIRGFLYQFFELRGLLAKIISTSALVQILSAAMPLLTGVLIDRVVPFHDYYLLYYLAAGFCVLQMLNAAAGWLRAHLMIHLRTQVEARMTLRFLDHLIGLPYSYFQQHTSGDLIVRLSSNSAVRDILTSAILSTLMDGTMATLYLSILLITSVRLTAFVIALAVVRLLLLATMRSRQRQLLSETLENQSSSQTCQVELLSGMETLKAMGAEQEAATAWSNLYIDGLNVSIRRARLDAGFSALLSIVGTVSTLVIMFYGIYLVLKGSLTLGELMAFSALAAAFSTPFSSLVSSGLQLQMLEIYLERLNEVIELPPEQTTPGVIRPATLKGAVSINNVCFRYAPSDHAVLDCIDLEIPAGARVALVGRSGSGKSTLARLMAGLYKPDSGTILYDNLDIRVLDLRSVRRRMGIVTQESQLFGGSIRRNIALRDPQIGLDRVMEAARLACLHDEITALPMGYDTPLFDGGLSLSGGQRQRLAIARAVVDDPAILILDEATSHLDAVTENLLTRNLRLLGCTQIVIAHRLSTIQDADFVAVLDHGRIVQKGNHAELLKTQGLYAELVEKQSSHQLCSVIV